MDNVITSIKFSDGRFDEFRHVNLSPSIVSIVEDIQLAILLTVIQGQLSGQIGIEVLDNILYISFNVYPSSAIPLLRANILLRYAFTERNN